MFCLRDVPTRGSISRPNKPRHWLGGTGGTRLRGARRGGMVMVAYSCDPVRSCQLEPSSSAHLATHSRAHHVSSCPQDGGCAANAHCGHAGTWAQVTADDIVEAQQTVRNPSRGGAFSAFGVSAVKLTFEVALVGGRPIALPVAFNDGVTAAGAFVDFPQRWPFAWHESDTHNGAISIGHTVLIRHAALESRTGGLCNATPAPS